LNVQQSELDFKTATSRRDFTINSIGYDIQKKRILDPFHGVDDLKRGILREVDNSTFKDDPLRLFRAVQFAARFHFLLEPSLISLCQQIVQEGLLRELAKERVYEEFVKLLLKSSQPSYGFLLFKKLHLFEYFKELAPLGHKDFTKILHTLDSYQKRSQPTTDIILMLSLIIVAMREDKQLQFLQRLTTNKRILEGAVQYAKYLSTLELKRFSNYEIYLLATKIDIEQLTYILKAYHKEKRELIDLLLSQATLLGVKNQAATPLIKGRDLIKLGLKPSREFSSILQRVYDLQLQGVIATYEEGIEWIECRLPL